MRAFCSLIVSFLLFFYTESLKITFNPSNTLTKLSVDTWNSKQLNSFVFELLRNKELWPLLVALNEAKLFNFQSLLVNSTNMLGCGELLKIMRQPDFPLKKVFGADSFVLRAACFSKLPLELLDLGPNPLESSIFNPYSWSNEQLALFAKSAHDSNLSVDWNVFCVNADFFDAFMWDESVHFVWDLIELDSFKKVSMAAIDVHIYKTSSILFRDRTAAANAHETRTDDTNLLTSYVFNFFRPYKQEEIDFSIRFVIRILSIAAIMTKFNRTHAIYLKCSDILYEHLSSISANKQHKFPMRKKLIFILRQLNSGRSTQQRNFLLISVNLLRMVQACIGRARGSWLLRILSLWNHFRGNSTELIEQFLDPFLEIFFDPETQATAHETCQLFRFLNQYISPAFSELAIVRHFPYSVKLAESFYSIGYDLIPRYLRSDSLIFPLDFRLSFIFKKIRRIDRPPPGMIEISRRDCWIKFIFKFKDKVNLDRLLPMNWRFFYDDKFLNFSQFLKLFFDSILASPAWWISEPDNVIIPSPTLPPQTLEMVGFMLVRALSLNVKVPFTIDFNFWKLIDRFPEFSGENFMPAGTLFTLYPFKHDFYSDQQVFRVSNSLDLSLAEMLEQALSPESFLLGPSKNLFPHYGLTGSLDLFRIAWTGSKYLRAGVAKCFNPDSLYSPQLYEMIFRNK